MIPDTPVATARAALAAVVLALVGLYAASDAPAQKPTLSDIAIRLLDENDEPLATAALPETVEEIAFEVRSEHADEIRIAFRLIAVDVLGWEPGAEVGSLSSRRFREGDVGRITHRPREGRLEIGRYTLEAVTEDDAQATFPFVVEPLHRPAEIVEETDPDRINVALAALGGRVVRTSSDRGEPRWAADNLIDGFARIRNPGGNPVSEGWRSEVDDWPAEIVIGFHEERAPMVGALVLESAAVGRALPADLTGMPPRTEVPRFVEILAGETPEPGAFESLGTVRLWNRTVPQLVEIDPRPIRYLMLRVPETYGARTTALAEIQVLEAASGQSILDDVDRNLARPALGGGLVAFTSQDYDNPVVHLVDGRTGPESGWSSAASAVGGAARLPQDLVFGFRDDRVARIDRVEIDPESSPRWAVGGTYDGNWPRVVSIGISTESPDGPFEEIGRFELDQVPGPHAIPVGREARYLRVRVLENHGGSRTTIGEIAVIEAGPIDSQSGVSVLLGEVDPGWTSPSSAPAAIGSLPKGRPEVEPNDAPEDRGPLLLGITARGAIDPADDVDRYRLTVPGAGPQTVTLDIRGDGPLRFALDLTDEAGEVVKRFRPDARTGDRVPLTWQLEPGDYEVSLWEPERVTALVWDTSGSMEGHAEALERAVRGYVEALHPHESLVLIRFSDSVETLLPEPSRDVPEIMASLDGQFRPEGGTRLFDALPVALDALEGAAGQRTIIALTDGQDTGRNTELADLRRRLLASDVRLVTIGLGSDMDDLGLATANTGHGVLRSLAQAGGGRYVVEPRSEDLPALYAAIAETMGGVQRYAIRAEVSEETGQLALRQTGEPIPSISAAPGVTLILDGSGSMRRQIDGRPMIEIARDVLTDLVRELPDGVEAGLWTFGHRVREGRSGDCTDVEELVPLGPLDREGMLARLARAGALGTTPIAETLERVGAALPRDDERRQLIVVVTDGEEECRDDLIPVVRALVAQGLDVSVNIVGFALDRPEVVRQLAAAANAGNGRFFNATEPAGLADAVDTALAAPFTVHDSAGDPVLAGTIGDPPLELPVGRYEIRVETRDGPFTVRDVEVTADRTTEIRLDKQAEEIGVAITDRPLGEEAPEEPPVAVLEPSRVEPTPSEPPEEPVSTVGRAEVLRAQALLTALGYDPGPVDGLFGRRTATAIETFRTDRAVEAEEEAEEETEVAAGSLTPDVLALIEAEAEEAGVFPEPEGQPEPPDPTEILGSPIDILPPTAPAEEPPAPEPAEEPEPPTPADILGSPIDILPPIETVEPPAEAAAPELPPEPTAEPEPPAGPVTPPAEPPPATAVPAVVFGQAQVISTDSVRVDGEVVTLAGIVGVADPAMVQQLQTVVDREGGALTCQPVGGGHACVTPTGFDLGHTVLYNGAGRMAAGAPPEYADAEARARSLRLGVWR